MPYTEELPANYRTRLPCKRRCCPHQRLFEQQQLNGLPPKQFFTYECKDFILWQRCLRQIEPTDPKPTKEAKPKKPKEQPKNGA